MRFGPALLLSGLLRCGAAAVAAVPVTVAPLAELLTRPVRSAPAEVETLNASLISAEIGARIQAIPVRVGDPVSEGDLLAALDCRDYRSGLAAQEAVLEQLRARRRLARSQLARARDLSSARNISEEQLEQRETELAVLAAEIRGQEEAIRQAEIQVERCEVRAPFDAVVTERLGQVGALASPGTALVRIVQQGGLEVSAALTSAEAAEAAEAPALTFEHDGERLPVRLRRLNPVMERRTQTREARLVFMDGQAPPGAAGRLQWESPDTAVPADLVVRRDGVLGLFLANSRRARFHPLPDALEGSPAAVDLPGDTLVVLEGRQGLSEGDALDVRREAP